MSKYLGQVYLCWESDAAKVCEAYDAAGLDPRQLDVSEIWAAIGDVYSDDYGHYWHSYAPSSAEIEEKGIATIVAECESSFDAEVDRVIAEWAEEAKANNGH